MRIRFSYKAAYRAHELTAADRVNTATWAIRVKGKPSTYDTFIVPRNNAVPHMIAVKAKLGQLKAYKSS